MNPELNASFGKATKWRAEAVKLREVLLDCGLDEELKWRKPCYTFEGKNIAIIQRMNDFLALMFFKGALLKDPKGVLKKQGENSQSARRLEFTSAAQITKLEKALKAYVREAIQVEKAGVKVERKTALTFPAELERKLARDRKFKAAFQALTPGRQRGYNLYFSAPKQSKTREARIEKCAARILEGKGLHDR